MSRQRNLSIFDRIGHHMVGKLEQEGSGYTPFTRSDLATMRKVLRPGDLLLVEGNRKVSAIIKYLTQSTWSHVALYVGDRLSVPVDAGDDPEDRPCLIEVNLGEGCIAKPLNKYESYNTRICRPIGLSDQDRDFVIQYMIDRIGLKYDHSNIFDMLRYFFPIPVPRRFRRRMIALGSGEPTRAICSTLIAKAFQEVNYPILPVHDKAEENEGQTLHQKEILHIRHHSLFVPRDFDLSPYFAVIKPTIEMGFDYKTMNWSGEVAAIDPLDKRGPGGLILRPAKDAQA